MKQVALAAFAAFLMVASVIPADAYTVWRHGHHWTCHHGRCWR